MTLDEGHLVFVAITYEKVSLRLWKRLENLEYFSPTLKKLNSCNAIHLLFLWVKICLVL